jgi:hypothetical protein
MAITVGRLYIFAASSATDIFEVWRLPSEGIGKLTQIWPIKRNVIGWPPVPLSDRDADQIAGSFFRFAEAVARLGKSS